MPSAPRNLTLTPANGEITATWDEPENDGGFPVTAYMVFFTPSGGTRFYETVVSETTATITGNNGLTNGTEYTIQVWSRNLIDWWHYASASATPVSQAPDAPVVTLTPGDGQIVADWDAPDNGGTDITNYKLQYMVQGSNSWTAVDITGSPLPTT